MEFDLFWIVEHINIHLLSRFKLTFSWFYLEYFVFQYMPLKSLFITWFSWVSPWFKFNFLVIRHFECPVSSDPSYVFQRQCYFSRLWPVLDGYLPEVPREYFEVLLQIVNALISLVRIVELLLAVIQGIFKFLIQCCESESLPQIGSADLIVPDVCEPQEREISHGMNLDECLLNYCVLQFLSLSVDGLHFFAGFVPRSANQVDVEVESQGGFEGDVHFLLRLGIDDALWSVELEALLQNLPHLWKISLSFISVL